MANFAKTEDAPHHLIRLDEYGKTSVTIAIAFLGLSTAFVDKLLKPPAGWTAILLVALLWLSLLAVLVLGLLINASLVGVSANYAKAKGVAYPDSLKALSDGEEVALGVENQKLKVEDGADRRMIKDALKLSSEYQTKAVKYANTSFVMIFFAGAITAATGFYHSLGLVRPVEAGDAVEKSIDFVKTRYGLNQTEAKFHTLTFDGKSNTFLVEILGNPAAAGSVVVKYEVTIDGETGDVKKSQSLP